MRKIFDNDFIIRLEQKIAGKMSKADWDRIVEFLGYSDDSIQMSIEKELNDSSSSDEKLIEYLQELSKKFKKDT